MKLIIFGFLIHLLFMGAIFDIYFKSPIITGLKPLPNERPAPAKRLVLFVADGLRAESLYGKDMDYMNKVSPYLCEKIKSNRAAWGISHTRVPTESRPGHVALIAGMYEDPSAIAKGWKENPVDFDSVFNESFHTWAWGSPDIVPMFKKSENVDAFAYSSTLQDFGGKESTSLLDQWVFEGVDVFFNNKSLPENTKKLMRSDKIIFFLHLLGLDTAGHSHKPGSDMHTSNIATVDTGVEQIEQLIKSFYGNTSDSTVFIYTADHGMTNWGSHGAGSKDETETPFIAWGAGIKPTAEKIHISQADVAPLMSTLLGIPIPVNSVGVLPTEILDVSIEEKAHALFLNAKQIFAQFDEKRSATKSNSIWFLYRPYDGSSNQKFDDMMSFIQDSIKQGDFQLAINASKRFIKIALQGLDYYQNYYQPLLLTCVTFMYLGWIGVLLIYLTDSSKERYVVSQSFIFNFSNFIKIAECGIIVNIFFISVIIVTFILLYAQSLPFMFYIYCILPLCLWWYIFKRAFAWLPKFYDFFESKKYVCLFFVLCITGIESLVYCFFYRPALSVTLSMMAAWPHFVNRVDNLYKFMWSTSCLILAVFPFMPVVGSNFNIYLISIAAVLWTLLLFVTHYLTTFKSTWRFWEQLSIAFCQMILLAVSVHNLFSVDKNIIGKEGLLSYNQFCSWISSGLALFGAMCGPTTIIARLVNIAMGLLVPFILLSVSYEPLFLLVLFVNLLLWLHIEHQAYNPAWQHLTDISFKGRHHQRGYFYTSRIKIRVIDFRRGFFITAYAVLAFFGLGNMASINSFDPMWTRNFVTIFNPFLMGGLILFKTLIPYLLVTCVFRAITTCLHAPVKKMFFIVLVFCDVLGLHFLFLVQNTGSWLEIGSSISHYVIVQAMALFLLLLYVLVVPITSTSLTTFGDDVPTKVHHR